jgi:hypothetical protein
VADVAGGVVERGVARGSQVDQEVGDDGGAGDLGRVGGVQGHAVPVIVDPQPGRMTGL